MRGATQPDVKAMIFSATGEALAPLGRYYPFALSLVTVPIERITLKAGDAGPVLQHRHQGMQPQAPTPCGPGKRESESHAEGCIESRHDSKALKHFPCEGSL